MGDLLARAQAVQQQGTGIFGPGGPFAAFTDASARPFGNQVEGRLPGAGDTGFRNMTGLSNPFYAGVAQTLGQQPMPFSGDPAGPPGIIPRFGGGIGSGPGWGPMLQGDGGRGGGLDDNPGRGDEQGPPGGRTGHEPPDPGRGGGGPSNDFPGSEREPDATDPQGTHGSGVRSEGTAPSDPGRGYGPSSGIGPGTDTDPTGQDLRMASLLAMLARGR